MGKVVASAGPYANNLYINNSSVFTGRMLLSVGSDNSDRQTDRQTVAMAVMLTAGGGQLAGR